MSVENITDAGHKHTKRVNKFRGISWSLCSKQDIIVSWCIEEFSKHVSGNIWILACSLSYCTRISMESNLKKTKVKLNLLIDINMLPMVRKGIKNEACHAVHRFTKAYNKYEKDYNKNRYMLSIGMQII